MSKRLLMIISVAVAAAAIGAPTPFAPTASAISPCSGKICIYDQAGMRGNPKIVDLDPGRCMPFTSIRSLRNNTATQYFVYRSSSVCDGGDYFFVGENAKVDDYGFNGMSIARSRWS